MSAKSIMHKGTSPGWVTGSVFPYIIAEAGVNHNGKLEMALSLVDAAVAAGADCVKFQAFTASDLVTPEAQKADYQKRCGEKGETQLEMLRRYELSEGEFRRVKEYCDERGIDFLITPFSPLWVEYFLEIGVSAFKLGSGNLGAPLLLDAIGRTRMPVIVSSGMADLKEVDQTLERLRRGGASDFAMMHCVSLYPTRLDQINLFAIRTLAQYTRLPVGLSDHTEEVFTGALGVAAGAELLEKHMTLDKGLDGPDHKMSLTPEQMRDYVRMAREAARACGTGLKEPLPDEIAIKEKVRMSLVAAVSIPAGTRITREMLNEKRPGSGISALHLDRILGCVARRNIVKNALLQVEDFENPPPDLCPQHREANVRV